MARTSSSTPSAGGPPELKKSTSGSQTQKNQKSILGFFSKTPPVSTGSIVSPGSQTPGPTPSKSEPAASSPSLPDRSSVVSTTRVNGTSAISKKNNSLNTKRLSSKSTQSLTPVASSDAPGLDEEDLEDQTPTVSDRKQKSTGLPSPVTPADEVSEGKTKDMAGLGSFSSPSRKAKKSISYAESTDNDDDEEEVYKPIKKPASSMRASKRRKVVESSEEEDTYMENGAEESDDLDDFIAPDDSEEEVRPKKRKRPSQPQSRNSSSSAPRPTILDEDDEEDEIVVPSTSTAQQWTFDPENPKPLHQRPVNVVSKKADANAPKRKEKAHTTEPSQRYPWLANIADMDRNPPGHPDYDKRTIYVPPSAWKEFSPFEKQYWEIKQKFWDTIVFFKKGKFYELYENDATIGHQLFNLKLTDRVNMRMVGVPEMSLEIWANQFVAKGYKIARVDQSESALGKEMRERDGQKPKKSKDDKIIKRELACVLTAGTLVDGSMLQDDMSTYCVSIKEGLVDEAPAFGITFVDTATGQFYLVDFVDDMELTKFETFVAQTRPQELLLEKGCVSVKALRILKNNTGPTTIFNYLKPGKEFWATDIACKDMDASGYFVSATEPNIEAWPKALREARDKPLVMSAVGALVYYLRELKIERELLTMGNFSWYDPIKKASSLVLDGQTLINLEIFANSYDGSSEGTLFTLLNRCITPFGKRLFKHWVCHPLMDTIKINARLDAVESLNADPELRDRFTSQLTKLPDLERLISRIHAGHCTAENFVRVLEGFEQIDYVMGLVKDAGAGDGVIGQIISAMPDLDSRLKTWKSAFDRLKAKENGILVPEAGVEGDFDDSQDKIEEIHSKLDALLKKTRKDLGSTAICYRDNGKEIYQIEVPVKVKAIPKAWDQMSATKQVKRYYFPELRSLVRQLQEAQETHSQIVKDVARRFYARFDEDYEIWLGATKLVAQLDCLISLAKASVSLGSPSCRPLFLEDERSIVEFEELRHPCMLPNVGDFIPNDVKLGGDSQKLTLLTGANAAGKSTVLRMTCVAVIMAQLGCFIPCASAALTPVDRIMSRLGANDNIFAAQSTFFVELAETKKILSEATPRSLVILDELGRGTSSYDGLAVAQAVLHHVSTHIGCLGFFASHYRSLAVEFAKHPEIRRRRMAIEVDDADRRITFLYKLEDGVAEGSFGMHCAAMCGISEKIVSRAEEAAAEWECTGKLKGHVKSGDAMDVDGALAVTDYVPLGWWSDLAWLLRVGEDGEQEALGPAELERGVEVLRRAVANL